MSFEQTGAALAAGLATLPIAERVEAINAIRRHLHSVSPFASEPVDFVEWLPADDVHANDYNPNSVAANDMIAAANEAIDLAAVLMRFATAVHENDQPMLRRSRKP